MYGLDPCDGKGLLLGLGRTRHPLPAVSGGDGGLIADGGVGHARCALPGSRRSRPRASVNSLDQHTEQDSHSTVLLPFPQQPLAWPGMTTGSRESSLCDGLVVATGHLVQDVFCVPRRLV